MIQSGQKFITPAAKGTAPKKNQGLENTNPIAIRVRPSAIRSGWQIFRMFIKFIKILSGC